MGIQINARTKREESASEESHNSIQDQLGSTAHTPRGEWITSTEAASQKEYTRFADGSKRRLDSETVSDGNTPGRKRKPSKEIVNSEI